MDGNSIIKTSSSKIKSKNKHHHHHLTAPSKTSIGGYQSPREIAPGIYYGLVKHVDGNYIPVRIEVKPLQVSSQPRLYNVCIGFDRSNDYGINQNPAGEFISDSDKSVIESNNNTSVAPAPTLVKMSRNLNFHSTSLLLSENEMAPQLNPAAKFSIGGSGNLGFGSLRECDSDSMVDFIVSSHRSFSTEQLHSASNVSLIFF